MSEPQGEVVSAELARRVTAPRQRRAFNGTVTARLHIQLSPQLDSDAKAAARREGCSVADWWRRAAQARLRPAGGPAGKAKKRQ